MRVRNILGMILAANLVLASGDFWTARQPSQWSPDEIKKMVTDSPWAQAASVDLKGGAGTIMGSPGGIARGGFPGPGAGGDRSEDDGDPVLPKIVVRWDSAVPVSEACATGGLESYLFTCTAKLLYVSGLSKKFAELAREFYIVSMSNYPKMLAPGQGREAPQHSAAANAALEQMGQRIQQMTFLRRKGKNPIRPAQVVVLPAGQGFLPIVFFPRTEAITLGDKVVSFESADGIIVVSAKFNLSKMVYKGELEL